MNYFNKKSLKYNLEMFQNLFWVVAKHFNFFQNN